MADTQVKLDIATLGTRQEVLKVKADVVVTAGAATTSTLAITFDNPFVNIPEIISVISKDSGLTKGNIGAHTVTKTGLTAYIYQVLSADVASATYTVEVTLYGWKAA